MEPLETRDTPAALFEAAFAVNSSAASDIAADNDGNTYVAGAFAGEVNFNPTRAGNEKILISDTYPNPNSPSGFSYLQQSYVAKYDPSGACVWALKLNAGMANAVAVKADLAGTQVLVTGNFGGSTTFGNQTLTSVGDQDAYVVKVQEVAGESGVEAQIQWAQKWGGDFGFDDGYDVAIDGAGDAYGVGRVNLTPGQFDVNFNAYVTKLQGDTGQFLWSKQVGSNLIDEAHAVKIDSTGNVLIGGNFKGTADFDPGPATFTLASGGKPNDPSGAGFVLKLAPSGSFVWARHFAANTRSSSSVADLAVHSDDSVYVVGDFNGTVDFNPDSKKSFSVTGSSDSYAVRLDSLGQFAWAKTFGGNSNFNVFGAAVDAAGSLYITGSFRGAADFDPSSGVYSRTSAGDEDAFAMKLSSTGVFDWAATMGGAAIDRPQGVAVDGQGNVYLAGMFQGAADYDPSSDEHLISSGPNRATFWLKLGQQ